MTKFLNISTDVTLGGNSPSDEIVVSQKAIATVLATKQDTLVSGTNIKTVNGTSLLGSGDIVISASVNWGFIGGTLADQTDLKNALDAKQDTITNLSTIESGAAAGATAVQPGDLATVATSGSYNDLSNKPTMPEGVPAGTIIAYAGSSAPSGYLVCDGGAVSRTTYSALFSAIGTKYGTGDGSTTFNLPSMSDYVLRGTTVGGDVGGKTNGNLPNITGGYGLICNGSNSSTTRWYAYGAMYQETTANRSVGSSGASATGHGVAFDASRSSSIYGSATYVRPKSMLTLFCIKY